MLERLNEGVLAGVSGLLGVSQDAPAEGQDRLLVAGDDGFEGPGIASQTSCDDLTVFHECVIHVDYGSGLGNV
jgi:hypothetical protein